MSGGRAELSADIAWPKKVVCSIDANENLCQLDSSFEAFKKKQNFAAAAVPHRKLYATADHILIHV